MILGVVVLHIWALHVVGQNNPAGIDPQEEKDTVAFTPYATLKDVFALAVFCIVFAWFVFEIPNYLGHADNYIPANPAVTPSHIVPEWYYLPFYAILRSIPNKLLGVTALFGSIVILAFLPWLDTSRVRSATYRPLYRQFFWIFVIVCIGLGWLGSKPAEGGYVIAARVLTAWYFLHFVLVLPLLGLFEKPNPLPNSISQAVLGQQEGDRRPRRVPRRRRAVASVTPSPASAQESEQLQPPRQYVVVPRPVRAVTIPASSSAASRSITKSARPAIASSWWRSATSAKPGGPEFTEAEVEAIAAQYKIKDGPNDQGEMFERPGRPADYFPPPFPNEQTARLANNGALPPDMSVLAKARQLRARLSLVHLRYLHPVSGTRCRLHRRRVEGYAPTPAGVTIAPGMQYNTYFPGHGIAMPPPLQRRRRELHRRRAGDGGPVRQGHRGVPDVGGRADARRAQAHRLRGDDLSPDPVGAAVLHQEKGLARASMRPTEAAHGQEPEATSL